MKPPGNSRTDTGKATLAFDYIIYEGDEQGQHSFRTLCKSESESMGV